MDDETTLFDLPAATPAPPARPDTPTWTRVVTRRRCDWCTRALAQADGTGPLADVARWKVSGADGDTLLCYRHGQEVRAGELA